MLEVVPNEPPVPPNADTIIARQFHTATSYRPAPTDDQPERVGMGPPGDIGSPIWQEDWSIETPPLQGLPGPQADSISPLLRADEDVRAGRAQPAGR